MKSSVTSTFTNNLVELPKDHKKNHLTFGALSYFQIWHSLKHLLLSKWLLKSSHLLIRQGFKRHPINARSPLPWVWQQIVKGLNYPFLYFLLIELSPINFDFGQTIPSLMRIFYFVKKFNVNLLLLQPNLSRFLFPRYLFQGCPLAILSPCYSSNFRFLQRKSCLPFLRISKTYLTKSQLLLD